MENLCYDRLLLESFVDLSFLTALSPLSKSLTPNAKNRFHRLSLLALGINPNQIVSRFFRDSSVVYTYVHDTHVVSVVSVMSVMYFVSSDDGDDESWGEYLAYDYGVHVGRNFVFLIGVAAMS